MANNYTLGSFIIPLEDQEHVDFANELIECAEDESIDFNLEIEEAMSACDTQYNKAVFCAARKLILSRDNYEPGDVALGFVVDFQENGIHVYHDEQIDVDSAACFAQVMLSHFESDKCVTFTAAFTCDKPRPDEFGGVGAFITADNIDWMSTYTWMEDILKLHNEKKA